MKGRPAIVLGSIVALCLAAIVLYRLIPGKSEQKPEEGRTEGEPPAAVQVPGAAAPLRPEDAEVDGIGLFSTAAQVIEIHGEPLARETRTEESFHNPDWTVYWTDFTYRDMKIGLFASEEKTGPAPADPGAVYRIEITGRGPRTRRGVGIGDSLAKVYEQYGRGEMGDGKICYYSGELYIAFAVRGGKVVGITVGSLFD